MQPDTQTGTINPVFAGYAAQQLQEATGGIDRVFDNLRKIARGDDPDANGYDRLRATRVLYDRGMGKVTKNQPRTPSHESERDPKSEESNNPTNHSSDNNRRRIQPTRRQARAEARRRTRPSTGTGETAEQRHSPDQARRARPLTRRSRLHPRPRPPGPVLRTRNHQLRSRARLHLGLHTRTRPRRHLHQAVPPHHCWPDDTRPRHRRRRRPRAASRPLARPLHRTQLGVQAPHRDRLHHPTRKDHRGRPRRSPARRGHAERDGRSSKKSSKTARTPDPARTATTTTFASTT